MSEKDNTKPAPHGQARRPSPAEIRHAIFEALADDHGNAATPTIPPHVYSLVADAITAECDRVAQ